MHNFLVDVFDKKTIQKKPLRNRFPEGMFLVSICVVIVQNLIDQNLTRYTIREDKILLF